MKELRFKHVFAAHFETRRPDPESPIPEAHPVQAYTLYGLTPEGVLYGFSKILKKWIPCVMEAVDEDEGAVIEEKL